LTGGRHIKEIIMARRRTAKVSAKAASKVSAKAASRSKPEPSESDSFVIHNGITLNRNAVHPGVYRVGDTLGGIVITPDVKENLMLIDRRA